MKTLSLPKQAIHTGSLILVNRKYRFCGGHTDTLLPVSETGTPVLLNCRAVALLDVLMKEIQGWQSIVPVSGWRSHREQQKIWDDSLAESGLAFTRKYVALPGHSEHQTGLAIDLGLKQETIDFIRPDFPYSGICQTFRSRAARFGFIERYPAGKEAVTGIGHEPWHFRYVGVPHACIMTQNRLTLEEYTDFLKAYPYGQRPYHYRQAGLDVTVSYLKAAPSKHTVFLINADIPYSVSGNNADGFIITEWRGHHAEQANLRWA